MVPHLVFQWRSIAAGVSGRLRLRAAPLLTRVRRVTANPARLVRHLNASQAHSLQHVIPITDLRTPAYLPIRDRAPGFI